MSIQAIVRLVDPVSTKHDLSEYQLISWTKHFYRTITKIKIIYLECYIETVLRQRIWSTSASTKNDFIKYSVNEKYKNITTFFVIYIYVISCVDTIDRRLKKDVKSGIIQATRVFFFTRNVYSKHGFIRKHFWSYMYGMWLFMTARHRRWETE